MAESNETPDNNVFSANDPLDINELASLNEEISNDFIDQLQKKIAAEANIKNDGDLFEEPSEKKEKSSVTFNNDIDDNFIKKYKAKLNKKQNLNNPEEVLMPAHSEKDEAIAENVAVMPSAKAKEDATVVMPSAIAKSEANETVDLNIGSKNSVAENAAAENHSENAVTKNSVVASSSAGNSVAEGNIAGNTVLAANKDTNKDSIEAVTGGNIIEKPLSKEAIEYNESLDYLDNNVKYSKYVIYINPENKDFIESLTVKERKNLINRIIREQDSIAVTKRKFGKVQTAITHIIIAILTVTISVPCIYWAINASLEATINNYRASQTAFGQLYREHGKIKTKSVR